MAWHFNPKTIGIIGNRQLSAIGNIGNRQYRQSAIGN
jgi:hypothetical protein